MNLEQAIHERWATASPLYTRLPAASVRTGLCHDVGTPRAEIRRKSSRTLFHTNAFDAVDEVLVAIDVWHDDHDAGRALLDEIRVAFDRLAFNLDEGRRAIQMRCLQTSTVQ